MQMFYEKGNAPNKFVIPWGYIQCIMESKGQVILEKNWFIQCGVQPQQKWLMEVTMVGPMIGHVKPVMNQICTRKPHFVVTQLLQQDCPALLSTKEFKNHFSSSASFLL